MRWSICRTVNLLFDIDDKEKIDEISVILKSGFGICTQKGRVLYPEDREGQTVNVPQKTKNGFCHDGEEGYIYAGMKDGEKIFFFLENGDSADCEKILRIVLLNLKSIFGEENEKKKESFYRELLTVDDERARVLQKRNLLPRTGNRETFDGYAVLCIKILEKDDFTGDDQVIQVVRNIFPNENGFVTVPVKNDTIAVIAPISDRNTRNELNAQARALPMTVLSETMVKVSIAEGPKVNTPEGIRESFFKAEEMCDTGAEYGFTEGYLDAKTLGVVNIIKDAGEKARRVYVNDILGELTGDEKGNKELLDTVDCFLRNNQNISETSRVLYVHRNTLMYRVDKFNKMTGLDCTVFEDGVKVRVAIMLLRKMKSEQTEQKV